MVKKWKVAVPTPSGPDERWAYIYLPESYSTNPRKRFPVLYMFDGHNLFSDDEATYGKSWGLEDYMNSTGTDLIIAAVECNHSPDHGRLKEYSPFDFEDPYFGSINGYGKTTMDWITQVFKPYIDKHYRTLRGRNTTFIGGSSMGGLMSLYAVIAYNQYFSGAAALSPSLWTNPSAIESIIRGTRIRQNTRIYMDYGSEELRNHKGMKEIYQKISSLLLKKNIYLTSRIVPNGEHCEACWENQAPFYLGVLLYH